MPDHRRHGKYSYEVENHQDHGITTFWRHVDDGKFFITTIFADNPDKVCIALNDAEKVFFKLISFADRSAYRKAMTELLKK
jgi:hypothetical protein